MYLGPIKACLWKLIAVVVVGPTYVAVISEGMRLLVPTLGQKLHKLPIPGIGMLKGYAELYRLDIAHMMSIILLFAVWYLWLKLMVILFDGHHFFRRNPWNPATYTRVIAALAILILGADAALFYYAMTQQMGFMTAKTTLSIPALLATAAYVGVLVFISFVSFNLEHSDSKREA